MDSPYSITPQKCSHLRLGHSWFWSYYNVLLRMAAILDLSNMAATEGAHLGSLEKLVGDGHISPWSKNGACGTMWTIIWLSPLTIHKLHIYGIRGVVNKWFDNYLKDRTQFVNFDNNDSAKRQILCGVPQGSILGPFLYLIYVNDIAKACGSNKNLLLMTLQWF